MQLTAHRNVSPPPEHRTHADYCDSGRENASYTGPPSRAPYKESGVKAVSVLAALPLFNLVCDVTPDMMHIIQGAWKRHITALLKNERAPAQPKARQQWSDRANKRLRDEHANQVAILESWAVPAKTRKIIDKRSVSLGGQTGWMRGNMKLFKGTSAFKAHDWYVLVQFAADYVLHDMFPEDPEKTACLLQFKDACNLLIESTSAEDSVNRETIDDVKLRVIEALCNVERLFPKTELAIIFHIMVHVPDLIFRWNNIRNFWAFFGERCMGWLMRFVHNRRHVVENIVAARTRHQLILTALNSTHSSMDNLLSQLHAARIKLPRHSLLQSTERILEEKGFLAGEFKVELKQTRRNTKNTRLDEQTYAKLKQCCVQRKRREVVPVPIKTGALLIKQVHYNGRPVESGDVCVHLKRIPRTQSSDAHNPQHRRVCKIVRFYHVQCGDDMNVFAEIIDLVTDGQVKSLYVIDAAQLENPTADSTIIYGDALVTKLKIVPHFENTRFVCGVPMWETR